MSESKILTSEERLSTHEALLAEDHDPANVFASWVTRDDLAAFCATVRHLLEENRQLRASWEVSETRSAERLNLAFQDKFALQTEASQLTRERNEALDQCAELHRQIAALDRLTDRHLKPEVHDAIERVK